MPHPAPSPPASRQERHGGWASFISGGRSMKLMVPISAEKRQALGGKPQSLCTGSIEAPPTKISPTSQNSTTSQEPSVQTREPLLDISRSDPKSGPPGSPRQSPHTQLGQASSSNICWVQCKRQMWRTSFKNQHFQLLARRLNGAGRPLAL